VERYTTIVEVWVLVKVVVESLKVEVWTTTLFFGEAVVELVELAVVDLAGLSSVGDVPIPELVVEAELGGAEEEGPFP
jgi:hypothetical protein